MGTDAEAFRRSITDPDAFEEIFDRYADVVLAYARKRVGPTEGEEIASRTFEIAFTKRASFDPGADSARPWLLGIAANLIRRQRRDERDRLVGLAKLPRPGPPETIEDPERIDAARAGPALVDALRDLSSGERDAFLLVALADLTYEETARALGVPIGTVRSRIHRARARLREQITDPARISDGTEET